MVIDILIFLQSWRLYAHWSNCTNFKIVWEWISHSAANKDSDAATNSCSDLPLFAQSTFVVYIRSLTGIRCSQWKQVKKYLLTSYFWFLSRCSDWIVFDTLGWTITNHSKRWLQFTHTHMCTHVDLHTRTHMHTHVCNVARICKRGWNPCVKLTVTRLLSFVQSMQATKIHLSWHGEPDLGQDLGARCFLFRPVVKGELQFQIRFAQSISLFKSEKDRFNPNEHNMTRRSGESNNLLKFDDKLQLRIEEN